jgi:hypothetical protein
MAKLSVHPDLLADVLFPDKLGVRIIGASFQNDVVILELEGFAVPEVEQVVAIITKQQPIVVRFEAAG